jgi:hypothetical protein
MIDIKESVENDFLKRKNVVGVAIGQKWSNGVNTGEEAILVFVERKIDKKALKKQDLIPPTINGVKTDVVGKTGSFKSLAYTQKIRPICPGYSCGHKLVTAGTIGAFFTDWEGQVVGLSNNHVIAATNKARILIDSIYQPGVYDYSNYTSNTIGKLKRYRTLSSNLSFNAADWCRIYGYNLEDSGIFTINDGIEIDNEIPGIGYLNGFNDDVNVGDVLRKCGRTTQLTHGNVIATNASVYVNYDRVTYLFKDQIITSDMSDGGDSGSVTVDANNNAVGLLFAGSSNSTVHNRIRYPRASFGLEIYNPVSINESIGYTLVVDGNFKDILYNSIDDFADAAKYAKDLAKAGSSVALSVNYDVSILDEE